MVPGMFEALAVRVAPTSTLAGMRVLDVACGTGACPALTRAEAGVTGLDLAPPMLAIARELSPEIEFIEASADAIPFGDDAFDAATCQQGLQFFPNRQLGLTQIRRVVDREGRSSRLLVRPPSGRLRCDRPGAHQARRRRRRGDGAGAVRDQPRERPAGSDGGGGFSRRAVERETIEARFTDPEGFGSRVITAGPIALRSARP